MPHRNTRDADMSGLFFEDLSIGQSASFAKTVTDADILMFTAVSGDTNPVHLDEDYAATTRFEGRIAHGMLSAALISGVLGTQLPGPGTVYMSQTLRFRGPVKPGQTVTATVTVVELNAEKKRATLTTVCTVAGKPVIEGEALVMVPSRAA
jgi:3-hydroxybutyryl-CoA dehydratase